MKSNKSVKSTKSKYVWVPKQPSSKSIVGLNDIDMEILLRLDIPTLKNFVVNKHLINLINNQAFWCRWLEYHFGSAEMTDCEFLAKVSTNALFDDTTDTITLLLQYDIRKLYNLYHLSNDLLSRLNKTLQLMKKTLSTTFFWQLWLSEHAIDQLVIDCSLVSDWITLMDLLIKLGYIDEEQLDAAMKMRQLLDSIHHEKETTLTFPGSENNAPYLPQRIQNTLRKYNVENFWIEFHLNQNESNVHMTIQFVAENIKYVTYDHVFYLDFLIIMLRHLLENV